MNGPSLRATFLFHAYSGDLVFTAAALLILAVMLDLSLGEQRSLLRRLARILYLLSVPLGALATVPVRLWVFIPLVAAWMVFGVIGFRGRNTRLAWIAATTLVVLTIAAIIPEIRTRLRQPLPSASSALFVLGDSLSSGGFGETATWVERLRQPGLDVTNLSRPSETARSALESTIDDLESCRRCGVVIELGGNEMLDGDAPDLYEQNLRGLIDRARSHGASTIWLVEIPPLPGHWRWAVIHRRVADDTGSILIPRRILAAVLADPRNTLDGLHLNDRGHRELAEHMRLWLPMD